MTALLPIKPTASATSTKLILKVSVEVLQDAGTRKEDKKPVRNMVTNGLDLTQQEPHLQLQILPSLLLVIVL
jgi:hypothetical protein